MPVCAQAECGKGMGTVHYTQSWKPLLDRCSGLGPVVLIALTPTSAMGWM